MGYKVKVELYFSAAHRLKGYKGKCESLHGHNWRVEVTIKSGFLDKTGLLIDFKKAKLLLKSVLDTLDHKRIDNMPYFKKRNPTSEIVAEYIFNRYKIKIKPPMSLESVSVWETPASCAIYYE
ncbi:MAG: 6-carboxytetrahydropterin synthase QueD [Candidatus Omnitrophica bacterium]|jgi:6-pyruvoyltetrahydropterin/6-carboxytetrahydropterin synthase|nr:6-carboxytetrahydropterin synthase QueD [Candidatus Omnitrophota bacterium]